MILKAKNALHAHFPTCGKKAQLLSFLEPQVETIAMSAETWHDSFASLCLITIVLLSCTGAPIFCVVKDLERA
ncbi:hypothetical protein KSC_043790 [Ktedonobacter sp. SOSP1-52]|nr:hypothetical protein KSC_043790 [Ktedonobacter sp. SOSP1-52]